MILLVILIKNGEPAMAEKGISEALLMAWHKRINITDYHARLFVDSAMTMADFVLEISEIIV